MGLLPIHRLQHQAHRPEAKAGPVEFCSARNGLPQPHSGHMSSYAWTPPDDAITGPVVLIREKTDPANTYLLDDFTDCTVRAEAVSPVRPGRDRTNRRDETHAVPGPGLAGPQF